MSVENRLIVVALLVVVAIAVLGRKEPTIQEITSTDPLNTAPVGVIRDPRFDESSSSPDFGATTSPVQPIFSNG